MIKIAQKHKVKNKQQTATSDEEASNFIIFPCSYILLHVTCKYTGEFNINKAELDGVYSRACSKHVIYIFPKSYTLYERLVIQMSVSTTTEENLCNKNAKLYAEFNSGRFANFDGLSKN